MGTMSLDLLKEQQKEKQTELLQVLQSEEAGEEAIAQAFADYANSLQQALIEEARQSLSETSADKAVLTARGVRQLTSAEEKYYNAVIEAGRSSDFRQALSNIEIDMPETTIDSVFEDLEQEHPLLAAIDFQNTSASIKFIVNKTGVQLAVWGKLNSGIQKELEGSIDEIDAAMYKLTAWLPVAKDMLDLGPAWLDRYVRTIISEACLTAIEDAIVCGTGKDMPVGMNRVVGEGAVVSGGEYTEKTPIKVTNFKPKTFGNLISRMAVNPESGKNRTVSGLIMVVNPVDYFNLIMPATTAYTPAGAYVSDVLPYPCKIIQSARVPSGRAILGMGKKYFMCIGTSRRGRLVYDDSVKFFDDQRVYAIKFHGNGFPKDNNAFLYLDISKLEPLAYSVETLGEPAAPTV